MIAQGEEFEAQRFFVDCINFGRVYDARID